MSTRIKRRHACAALGYSLVVYGLLSGGLAVVSLIQVLQSDLSAWSKNTQIARFAEVLVAVLSGAAIILWPSRVLIALVVWCTALFASSFAHGWPLQNIDPLWLLAIFSQSFACLIGLVVLSRHTRHIRDSDSSPHCEQCGYALRGLSEPRCPECGRVYTLDEFYKL